MKRKMMSFSFLGGREINEDAVMFDTAGIRMVGVVADGLGGQGNGDIASRIVAEGVKDAFLRAPVITNNFIVNTLEDINAQVVWEQKKHPGRMMSTVAFVVVDGLSLLMAHLGDSRIYRFKGGKMAYCSRDHSATQLMVDRGEITREEMRDDGSQNLLFKCIGLPEFQRPDIKRGFLIGRERLLLCTDGLWELFTDDELARLISDGGVEAAMARVKEATLERLTPDSDNTTALIIG